jgi:thiamine pyrophosphokinase
MLYLIAGCPLSNYNFPQDALLVGVDHGAMELAKRNIKMVAAIGDFDSNKDYDFDKIDANADKIIQLSANKDLTDLEAAIAHFPNETDFVVYGGLCNRRVDHLLNQFHIMLKFENKNIKFIDDNNEVLLLKKGKHTFNLGEGFKYYSFFSFTKSSLSLSSGFKYPVTKQIINNVSSNFISNEVISDGAEVEVIEGSVFLIKATKEQ